MCVYVYVIAIVISVIQVSSENHLDETEEFYVKYRNLWVFVIDFHLFAKSAVTFSFVSISLPPLWTLILNLLLHYHVVAPMVNHQHILPSQTSKESITVFS